MDSELTSPLTEYEITNDTESYVKTCDPPDFTVALDKNKGDEFIVKEMIICCDRVYGEVPKITRAGYSFDGWFTDEDEGRELVKSEMIDKIIKNYTLHAHWLEDSTKQVRITFSSKDLTHGEIRDAIRQYTDVDFTGTLIENTNTEETRTIVMFINTESAKKCLLRMQTDRARRRRE